MKTEKRLLYSFNVFALFMACPVVKMAEAFFGWKIKVRLKKEIATAASNVSSGCSSLALSNFLKILVNGFLTIH